MNQPLIQFTSKTSASLGVLMDTSSATISVQSVTPTVLNAQVNPRNVPNARQTVIYSATLALIFAPRTTTTTSLPACAYHVNYLAKHAWVQVTSAQVATQPSRSICFSKTSAILNVRLMCLSLVKALVWHVPITVRRVQQNTTHALHVQISFI